MICPNCKNNIADDAEFCGNCGRKVKVSAADAETVVPVEVIHTYLTQSILVTAFCCIPFGIPAVIYAALANTSVTRQDYNGAKRNASLAKIWCWLAFGVGLTWRIVSIAIMCFGVSEWKAGVFDELLCKLQQ